MSVTHIMLLRHAETSSPLVFHGAESDIDLSAKGKRQADAIAQILRGFEPAVVVSSAMKRAVATAAPIALACAVPHLIEPELHERRIGKLSGHPFTGLAGIWPETQRRWLAGETAYAHEGAESLDDLQARIMPAWERLVETHRGKRLAVVAHGIVVHVILVSLLANMRWDTIASIRNVALTELIHDGDRWVAPRINDWPAEIAALEWSLSEPEA